MNCNKIEELLTAYLDNTITAIQKKEFEEHINNCSDCNSLVKSAEELLELQGKFEEEEIPPELLKKIKSEIENISIKKEPLPVLKFAYALIIVLLIGSAGYYLTSKNKIEKQKVLVLKETREKLVSLPTVKKADAEKIKPKIMKEKDVKEKVIELAKLPQQKMDFVFRGSEAIKKKKFIREWKGYSKEIEKEKYLLIGTQDKWYKLWKKHFEGSVPVIDFREYIILAVFSEANELQIVEVKETKDRYLVSMKETLKELGEEPAPGNPFHVVVLRI